MKNVLKKFLRLLLVKIASAPIFTSVMSISVVGVGVFFYGIYAEIAGETALREQGGRAAVDAYLAAMQSNPIDSILEYVVTGLAGQLPSVGGNFQATGIAIVFIGSALALILIGMARLMLEVAKALQAARSYVEKSTFRPLSS